MRNVISAVLLLLLGGCSVNNITIDHQLKTYFDRHNTAGTFALFDNSQAHFTLYDSSYYRKRFSPAATFNIVHALIGVETGVINDENMVIPWDGVQRSVPEWNKDLSMQQAFRLAAEPYFQEVARRIGTPTMQRWLDTLGYGNKNCSGAIDSFWCNQTLLISPDEQLGLVKRLYFNQLPFQKRTQELVRKVLLQESNTLYKLSYTTGQGTDAAGKPTGWVVGWIEENRHPYFFVLLLQSNNPAYNLQAHQLPLLKDILAHYDFMQGRK